jgi:hypothetical protein
MDDILSSAMNQILCRNEDALILPVKKGNLGSDTDHAESNGNYVPGHME